MTNFSRGVINYYEINDFSGLCKSNETSGVTPIEVILLTPTLRVSVNSVF